MALLAHYAVPEHTALARLAGLRDGYAGLRAASLSPQSHHESPYTFRRACSYTHQAGSHVRCNAVMTRQAHMDELGRIQPVGGQRETEIDAEQRCAASLPSF